MGVPDFDDTDALRRWLHHVDEPETTMWLMATIAVCEGTPTEDVAAWYDLSVDELRSWIREVEAEPLLIPIARHEGVDFDALAEAAGLERKTIMDWFRSQDARPADEVADLVSRYSQRPSVPLFAETSSKVHYLNHDVIERFGWSIADPDLFEKASNENLDKSEYGRFLVQPGETILEAAENRSISWPYACRGGACANCAVIVKEGDIAMPGQVILTDEQVRTVNARLTCVGIPVTEEVKLVMDVQELDEFEDLRLPSPGRTGEQLA